jgi:hypothetical protein
MDLSTLELPPWVCSSWCAEAFISALASFINMKLLSRLETVPVSFRVTYIPPRRLRDTSRVMLSPWDSLSANFQYLLSAGGETKSLCLL